SAAGRRRETWRMSRGGVGYVELRSLDLNPFQPLGVDHQQLHFLEAFLLFCLIQDSPPIEPTERAAIDDNQLHVALNGRHPTLELFREGRMVPLVDWGLAICEGMAPFCELLDDGDQAYSHSLMAAREALADPDLTPSARMLAEMRTTGEGFFHFAKRRSLEHRRHFLQGPWDEARMDNFRREAQTSLERQRQLEATDDVDFDEYLRRYFAQ
ncbi:MAG: glutamate--cysteine ligase, partial [Candidatus Competibacteraceae bacterium]|nr:glutamate--cysteine ligase [Candidatus Competibacteraceae bacterium]